MLVFSRPISERYFIDYADKVGLGIIAVLYIAGIINGIAIKNAVGWFGSLPFILLIILTPLLIFFSISFFEMKFNYWLQEIVGKHSVFLLNLVFDINVELIQTSDTLNPWIFIIPGGKFVYMSVGCTGIYSICIFIVLFICTPHSKDPETNQDIVWRKTKATIVSTLLIYITNILRITILNYLIYLGFSWGIIHNSIIHLSVQVITHIIKKNKTDLGKKISNFFKF